MDYNIIQFAESNVLKYNTSDDVMTNPNPAEIGAKTKPGRLFYSRWLLVLLVVLSAVLAVERIAIQRSYIGPEETVKRQLDALRRPDFAEAYRYASSLIRQQMDVTQFRAMIHEQYPEFVRSRNVKFNSKHVSERSSRMDITVTGEDGSVLRAVYLLGMEEGRWRVMAVQPVRGPDRRPPRSNDPRVTT